MNARVAIHGLRCRGRQGTTDAERASEHDYLVDVSVVADLARAIETDALTDAVDISRIASVVRESVAARPRTLVERITADAARAVLDAFPEVVEARVRVTKPRPAGLDADGESVELILVR